MDDDIESLPLHLEASGLSQTLGKINVTYSMHTALMANQDESILFKYKDVLSLCDRFA